MVWARFLKVIVQILKEVTNATMALLILDALLQAQASSNFNQEMKSFMPFMALEFATGYCTINTL
jgi:hypothetical protein